MERTKEIHIQNKKGNTKILFYPCIKKNVPKFLIRIKKADSKEFSSIIISRTVTLENSHDDNKWAYIDSIQCEGNKNTRQIDQQKDKPEAEGL